MQITYIIAIILIAVFYLIFSILFLMQLVVSSPFGLIGVVAFVLVIFILIKMYYERKSNKEDQYYSKNVDK